jgi:S1-C subfamily serine protease
MPLSAGHRGEEMPRLFLTLSAALLSALALSPQTTKVRVKVRVILVDKDLNQKPVPFLVVKLLNSAGGPETQIKTGLDGSATAAVAAGHYTISTPKPTEMGGKRYSWSFAADVAGAEQEIDLTNDNAKIEEEAPVAKNPSNASGDLTALFDKLKNSIFTVHADAKDGSGFLVDPTGLVVTNNHVVQSSGYLALQFDKLRKVPAKLLASNADKDVAILWVNPKAFPEAQVAPLVPADGKAHIEVGQRVFTIGNPFGREKVLTTGVISKVENDAITSDIAINPGNSGGPLFTLDGQAVGITTAGLRTLASIVPIQEARPLLDQARKNMGGQSPPGTNLLPVEPVDHFPAVALRPLLQQQKMDTKPYFFDVGEFQVAVLTPMVRYFLRHEEEMNAARKSAKRTSGDASQAKAPESALSEAQEYEATATVVVRPKYSVLFKVKFKNGFQKMRLLCGGKEVEPVDPGRTEFELRDMHGRVADTTYQGRYTYLPEAIAPSCGGMSLEIFSEKDPNNPISKVLDGETVQRVWNDFEPYRKAQTAKPH